MFNILNHEENNRKKQQVEKNQQRIENAIDELENFVVTSYDKQDIYNGGLWGFELLPLKTGGLGIKGFYEKHHLALHAILARWMKKENKGNPPCAYYENNHSALAFQKWIIEFCHQKIMRKLQRIIESHPSHWTHQ